MINTATLPGSSSLHNRVAATDFLDCYSLKSDCKVRKAAEIALTFPGWASVLLRLRNLIVMPFGLATGGPADANKISIFPIESETDTELIVGFDDKHLDFRISMLSESGRLFLATWVHPHNIGGKLYLRMVMPFHILIVRNALKQVAMLG